jgi:hypothetical protein
MMPSALNRTSSCSNFTIDAPNRASMSRRIDGKLTLDALDAALLRRRVEPGLIAHSDRGTQYAATDYQQRLQQQHGMICSTSRKGVQIAPQQRHIGAFDRDVRTGTHRDADVRLRERRRIVVAVASSPCPRRRPSCAATR